jgi:TetR/AcrR family transcriptional repressor of mexJK operon
MREPKSSQPPGTRKIDHETRILGAATEIFLKKGYEETSTADIARRAKVSKRELYANFRDKRDILAAVITELQAGIQSRANVSWSSTDDVKKVLTQAGTQILEFINSEKFGKLFRIVAAESFRDPVTAQKFYRLGPGAGRDHTAAFIRRHMKAGNLRKSDPVRAADDFLDLIISAHHLTAVVLGQRVNGAQPRAHVKHAVDLFLRYYGTDESSSPSLRSGKADSSQGNDKNKPEKSPVSDSDNPAR